MKQVFILMSMITVTNLLMAQDASEASPATQPSQRMNTIKIDLTSQILYDNALIFSYERVTKANQSFSVSLGYQEFPRVSSIGQNIAVRDDKKKNGFKFGGEYRFYLKKENKYLAPRGVYLGPYFMVHQFNNDRLIEVDNNGSPETVTLESKLGIVNIGVQLGYQFVLNDRWVIDLVLVGPSVSNYKYTMKIDGTYTFDKDDIQNEIILDLIDRFPFLEEAVSEKEATRNGKLDTWAYGYRYQLQIGYHFGRKRER
jgi:hypothetical protein